MTPTVACVLRSSKDFQPGAVIALYESVRKNWMGPLDFVALTDTPIGHEGIRVVRLKNDWPGYWSKLNLFDPAIPGDLLYFDLDVMVVGSLRELQRTRRLTMLSTIKPRRGSRVNSSIMYLPEAARAPVWNAFTKAPLHMMREYAWRAKGKYARGDQGFIEHRFAKDGRPVATWQKLCPGMVESYKAGVLKRGAVGLRTRVVYFHGKPRPWDIGWKLPPREVSA